MSESRVVRVVLTVLVAGIEVDDEARTIIGQGKELKKDSRPRKEDIVQE